MFPLNEKKANVLQTTRLGIDYMYVISSYKQELNSSVTSCDKARRGEKINLQYCSDLNGLEWRKLVFD
jgi:hypothetical protein